MTDYSTDQMPDDEVDLTTLAIKLTLPANLLLTLGLFMRERLEVTLGQEGVDLQRKDFRLGIDLAYRFAKAFSDNGLPMLASRAESWATFFEQNMPNHDFTADDSETEMENDETDEEWPDDESLPAHDGLPIYVTVQLDDHEWINGKRRWAASIQDVLDNEPLVKVWRPTEQGALEAADLLVEHTSRYETIDPDIAEWIREVSLTKPTHTQLARALNASKSQVIDRLRAITGQD